MDNPGQLETHSEEKHNRHHNTEKLENTNLPKEKQQINKQTKKNNNKKPWSELECS